MEQCKNKKCGNYDTACERCMLAFEKWKADQDKKLFEKCRKITAKQANQ